MGWLAAFLYGTGVPQTQKDCRVCWSTNVLYGPYPIGRHITTGPTYQTLVINGQERLVIHPVVGRVHQFPGGNRGVGGRDNFTPLRNLDTTRRSIKGGIEYVTAIDQSGLQMRS